MNLLTVVPETRVTEPLVQCGVLYLGTSPSKNSQRGLDAVQEPFSYQYPVDGTNTARGIDGVLSVYENGIQLSFTRQPEAAVFFPITSLMYCASLRFSIVGKEHTKPTAKVHWRFSPLDSLSRDENKHPPLFCAVTQRTHLLAGEECHCFITKTIESALALVRMTSRVYAKVRTDFKSPRAPVFYQLDHLGRKISETRDQIYLSPANNADGVLNRSEPVRLQSEARARKYLLNAAFGGYYYRSDLSLIEQWQLWNDNDFAGCRPHPPDSPFGLHEGLYHDDITKEIQRCLQHMDNEDDASSCSCSSRSSSVTCSVSTEYSRRRSRRRQPKKAKAPKDTDQFDMPLPAVMASSFEPPLPKTSTKARKPRPKPIIIEKVLPTPNPQTPALRAKAFNRQIHSSTPLPKQPENPLSFSYKLNERGEKITNEGNRIIFMDAVQPNQKNYFAEPVSYKPVQPRSRPRQRPATRHIPVVDIQRLSSLLSEQERKSQRRASLPASSKSIDEFDHEPYLTTADLLEIMNEYIGDYRGRDLRFESHEVQSEQSVHKRKNSVMSSTDSSKSETSFHHSRSTMRTGTTVQSRVPLSRSSPSRSRASSIEQLGRPGPPVMLTNRQVGEYVASIYGTAESIKSAMTSSTRQEMDQIDRDARAHAEHYSPLEYLQTYANISSLDDYQAYY